MKDLGEDQRQSSLSPSEVRLGQMQGGAGPRLSNAVTSDLGNVTEKVIIQSAADTKLGGVAIGSKGRIELKVTLTN